MAALITDTMSFRRLFLLLCLVWLILDSSLLFRGRVLPWDAINEFYPTVYFNAHGLRTGELPWWNPYIYGGYAQIGDPQGMLFSPLLMAWMLLPADPGATWFSWGVLLHMLMGATAMLAVLRRHGTNALGSLVGAIVYMGGGVAASRLEHVPIVIAYAYVPVVLLALRHFLATPGIARASLLGLAAGAMVTQLVQVTYLFVIVIGAYACVALGRHWPVYDTSRRRAVVGGLALAALVALVIGGPQLVFSWSAMVMSNRSDMALSDAVGSSLDARAFLFLAHPNAFGGLSDFEHAPIDPVQAFLYIGAIPLLALLGLGRAWRSGHARTIVCFGVLAVAATIYMLGTHTPIYGWLYGWMPGLVHFRRPSDAAYVLDVALAFLAGIGASRIDLRSRRELTVLLAVAAAWLAIAATTMLPSRATTFVAPAVALVALWQVRRRDDAWRAVVWLLVVIVADYRVFNFSGRFLTSPNEAKRYLASPEVAYLKRALETNGASPTARIATRDAGAIWDDGGMLAGIASTQGYNPLRYALYERWYRPRENTLVDVPDSPYNAPPLARLDDLLGVRYLVLGRGRPGTSYTPPAHYRLEKSFAYVDLLRNDRAYSRFLNPRRANVLRVEEEPGVAAFADTDFAETVWLTPRDASDLASAATDASSCHGEVALDPVRNTFTHQELRTRATSAGWVVAGELDHPGWRARLDGQPLPIHRANGMFRAVCVPAGEHRLSFEFHPWDMVAHAWRHRG